MFIFIREALKNNHFNFEIGWGGSGASFVEKKNIVQLAKNGLKSVFKQCYFSLLCRGGVSDSHVRAQILPIGARKGDEQVGRQLFFDKCQTTGVGGQVVQCSGGLPPS